MPARTLPSAARRSLLGAVCALPLVGCSDTPGTSVTTDPAPTGPAVLLVSDAESSAADGHVDFTVPDMMCPISCAPKVVSTLAEVRGVKSVSTDVDGRLAHVEVDPATFDAGAAVASLEAAGYPAQKAE